MKKQFAGVLMSLLLVCLLCACGSREPRNWIPVGGETAGETAASDEAAASEAGSEAPERAIPPETEAASSSTDAGSAEALLKTEAPVSRETASSEPAVITEPVSTTEPEASTEQEAFAESSEPATASVPDRSLAASAETTEGEAQVNYVANTNTKKFHLPSCSSVTDMKESNKLYFTGTREELIDQGYEPCKRCKP